MGVEGDKGKHLSNLQRAHWYVEWTLVCAPRLGLFFFSEENNVPPLDRLHKHNHRQEILPGTAATIS